MITIHPHEARLQQAKTAQRDPDWQQTYRNTRPTVERKIAHFTRRAWGGRRARRIRRESHRVTDTEPCGPAPRSTATTLTDPISTRSPARP